MFLAVFLRIHRRPEGHRARPFEPHSDGGAVCPTHPRHRRARRVLLGRETIFCLWTRQLPNLPPGHRRDRHPHGRAHHSGGRVRPNDPAPSNDFRRRSHALCQSIQAACAVAFRRENRYPRKSGAAGSGASGSTSWTASARRKCCTSFYPTGPTTCSTAPRVVRCPAMPCAS